jgi:hypothetical protein
MDADGTEEDLQLQSAASAKNNSIYFGRVYGCAEDYFSQGGRLKMTNAGMPVLPRVSNVAKT